MPKRNYGFEKRQKELKRQRKQAEKLQRKRDRTTARPERGETSQGGPPEPSPEGGDISGRQEL